MCRRFRRFLRIDELGIERIEVYCNVLVLELFHVLIFVALFELGVEGVEVDSKLFVLVLGCICGRLDLRNFCFRNRLILVTDQLGIE